VAFLIGWLTLCLIGVVLLGCLMHWAYSFIFVAIMIIGIVVFLVKFKQTQNMDVQMKAHAALSLACRSLNHK